jgi:hypothetical protein
MILNSLFSTLGSFFHHRSEIVPLILHTKLLGSNYSMEVVTNVYAVLHQGHFCRVQ